MKTIILLIIVITLFATSANAKTDILSSDMSNSTNNIKHKHEIEKSKNQNANNYQQIPQKKTNEERTPIKENDSLLVKYTRQLANFTLALAFFTLLLATTAIAQAIFLKKTVKATENAANAAQESARAISATERAYVFVNNIEMPYPYGLHHSANVSINYINTGKTFAILRKSNYKIMAIKNGDYPKPEFDESAIITEGFFLNSGNKFPLDLGRLDANISKDEINRIQNRELILICYGRIGYKDVFRLWHETVFCWEYSLESQSFHISPNDELNYNT